MGERRERQYLWNRGPAIPRAVAFAMAALFLLLVGVRNAAPSWGYWQVSRSQTVITQAGNVPSSFSATCTKQSAGLLGLGINLGLLGEEYFVRIDWPVAPNATGYRIELKSPSNVITELTVGSNVNHLVFGRSFLESVLGVVVGLVYTAPGTSIRVQAMYGDVWRSPFSSWQNTRAAIVLVDGSVLATGIVCDV